MSIKDNLNQLTHQINQGGYEIDEYVNHHPKELNQTYGQHLGVQFLSAAEHSAQAVRDLIHGVMPFCLNCEHRIKELNPSLINT